ncbi:MAG TPA: PAS domain-containing protein, partial [Kofleriaceae bacterium]
MSGGSLLSQQDCVRLLDATQELAAASQLAAIHTSALRWARELTGADGAAFVMREGDRVFHAADDAIAPLWKGRRFPIDACISGRCMTRGEPVAIANVLEESGISMELYAPTFVKSLALVPIRRAAPVGALGAYWATNHVASDRELTVLARLADGCAIAIANADRATQLEAARDEAARAQAAMKDRRRWLLDLLGHAPAVINFLRGPDMVFEFAHPLAVKALGGRQLEGKPVLEAVPEYAGQPFMDTLHEVYRTGKPYYGQSILAPIDRGNGQLEATYWDSVYLPTRTNGEIDGVMTFDVDVTERVRSARSAELAEVQLRELDERLRLALVAADIGTWDFNPATGALRWDARCKQLFGLPPDADVTYDTFLAGLHPEDRARTHAVVQRVIAGERGGEYDLEYRTVGLVDGIERYVAARGKAYFDTTGACVRFIGTIQDLTATKQADQRRLLAERAAEQAAERLRDLVMQSPIAMCVFVGPEHRYELANPRYHELAGREQLVGKTLLEVFPELAGSALVAAMDRTYQTGEPFSTDEFLVTIVRGGVPED